MGNTECITKGSLDDLDSLCSGRPGYPTFVAPNRDNVTYAFDYSTCEDILFSNGNSGVVSSQGFQVEPQTQPGERRISKSYTVKEYSDRAVDLRVRVSGRVMVNCSGSAPQSRNGSEMACAFKVCCRGQPIYQTFRTKSFTHTGQVVTSGIHFALFIAAPPGDGLYLQPRIMLVLESGDEVTLVDDKLGPMPAPQSFFADFAILDDGGRNVQMDLILRGVPQSLPEEGFADTGMRTLRTCLQEYTSFNNQVDPGSITFGSHGLFGLLPGSSVYLQNLVVSEEHIEELAPEVQPYGSCRHSPSPKMTPWPAETVLFEGSDVRAAAQAWEASELAGQACHPQIPKEASDGTLAIPGASSQEWPSVTTGAAEDFWYHIRYNELERRGPAESWNLRSNYDHFPPIKGEFWLTRKPVKMDSVYFHCSSTLAQAITMCVAFRFSFPKDFETFIQCRVGTLLETHIPTNGLVMGIERDPRHPGLLRMFMEHRNEILEDMVVCECKNAGLARTAVHQEVYDGGSVIIYRVTLVHKDGTRQSAVLQLETEKIEEGRDDRNGNRMRVGEEPSQRFPIEPCRVYHHLSPDNRIFVYSSSAYDVPQENDHTNSFDTAKSPCGQGIPVPGDLAEDWHSTGAPSDCEPDAAPHMQGRAGGSLAVLGARLQGAQAAMAGNREPDTDYYSAPATPKIPTVGEGSGAQPSPENAGAAVARPPCVWMRPLVESCLVLSGVEEPPFRCFPQSMP